MKTTFPGVLCKKSKKGTENHDTAMFLLSFKITVLYLIKISLIICRVNKILDVPGPPSHNQSHPGKRKGHVSLETIPLLPLYCALLGLSPSQWLLFISCPLLSQELPQGHEHLPLLEFKSFFLGSFPHSSAKWTCCWSVKPHQILIVS